jgi:DNA-binding transcriptional MerR regulator
MEESYTVAAVARRIGVAQSTLRTWDRRYGLGPSSHSSGTHRRYSPIDLVVLINMRRLITSGVAPRDAAVIAKNADQEIKVSELRVEVRDQIQLVESIIRAAFQLDSEYIFKILRQDLSENGVIQCWQSVIVPVLIEVGLRWEKTGEGIEVEHLLTEIIKTLFTVSSPGAGIEEFKAKNSRPVLLACVGEEVHSLALHALAAALAEREISSTFLGPRTPLAAICNLVNKSAPPALFLWAQLRINGDVKFFQDLPKVRPAPKVILGGPGWNTENIGQSVMATNLQGACDEIEQAIGA